ncbi:hypothetical protein ACP70R_031371 [Stipagrostis hirtigluma subsp. patula]
MVATSMTVPAAADQLENLEELAMELGACCFSYDMEGAEERKHMRRTRDSLVKGVKFSKGHAG